MSNFEHLRKIDREVDAASMAIITALAEARRTLGDSSIVTQELLHARIAVTNAAEAVEHVLSGESSVK